MWGEIRETQGLTQWTAFARAHTTAKHLCTNRHADGRKTYLDGGRLARARWPIQEQVRQSILVDESLNCTDERGGREGTRVELSSIDANTFRFTKLTFMMAELFGCSKRVNILVAKMSPCEMRSSSLPGRYFSTLV